jgi:hypothetical protein
MLQKEDRSLRLKNGSAQNGTQHDSESSAICAAELLSQVLSVIYSFLHPRFYAK